MLNHNLIFTNFRVLSVSLGNSYRRNFERNKPLYADCGGCERILPVSLSFWSNLKFFKMTFLAARLCGW